MNAPRHPPHTKAQYPPQTEAQHPPKSGRKRDATWGWVAEEGSAKQRSVGWSPTKTIPRHQSYVDSAQHHVLCSRTCVLLEYRDPIGSIADLFSQSALFPMRRIAQTRPPTHPSSSVSLISFPLRRQLSTHSPLHVNKSQRPVSEIHTKTRKTTPQQARKRTQTRS